MIPYSALPAANATLNATCGILLLSGYGFIRKKNIAAHRAAMISACIVALLFLTSYVVYHAHAGVHRYPGRGAVRTIYLWILGTHTVLAVLNLPLVVRTLYLALHSRFSEHRRLAHWTFPIWMYVSVTGVVVYFMLYH